MTKATQTPAIAAADISKFLPHSAPWILIDQVEAIDPPDRIQASRKIGADDPFVLSHFSGKGGVYPGVLLIEIIGQAANLLQSFGARANEGGLASLPAPTSHLLARCKANFHSPARANDLLTIRVERTETIGAASIFRGHISCGDRAICTVELLGASRND